VVRTPVGDVALRTAVPLPEGGRVGFEIAQTANNQVSLRIADLNGQPIQQALLQLAANRNAAAAQPGPLTQPPGTLPSTTASLSPGQVWTPAGALPLSQAGTLNAFVLAGSPLPGSGPANTTGQAQPGAAPAGQPGGLSTTLSNTLFTGSDLTIRVSSFTVAQTGTAAPQGVAPGILTPGTVTQPGPPAAPSQTAPPQGAPTGTGQTSGAYISTSSLQPTPQGANALLPASGGTQSGIRIVSAQGWPPAPLTTPTQVQASPIQLALTGLVTAQSTAAQTLIQTDAGTLQLGSRVNLPPGSTVTLEVLTQTPSRVDGTGAPISGAPPLHQRQPCHFQVLWRGRR